MQKAVQGVLLAAFALYLWGFVYWGFGPYRKMIWKQATDDAVAGEALRNHFPENGTYFIPGANHEQEIREGLFDEGPVAFVHMISVDGRPMFAPSIMVQGFFLNLVVIVMLALLMQKLGPAFPVYSDRVQLSTMCGLTAAILIDCGDAVWWQIDWPWMLYKAFYHFVAWTLTGCILAKFIASQREDIRPESPSPGD